MAQRRTKREARALRPTKKRGKEVRLENALPKLVNGPKTHLKGGMVRKHITQGVMA